MYTDVLDISRSLIEQTELDKGSVFIATISPEGNVANATFSGDVPKMINLLISLIKLADQRRDGAILKAAFIEVFSKGILEIQ
jgi:hypothetical protein